MTEEQLTQVTDTATVPDAAMEEHRAALAKMRTSYALEQLFSASGAKDLAILGRLIDVEQEDVVFGADGVPDVSAVRDKIEVLRREKPYLFADTIGTNVPRGAGADGEKGGASALRLGVMTQQDPSQMDDASYYRALLGRKRNGRR